MPFMRIIGVGGPWVRGKSCESIPVTGAVPDGHSRAHVVPQPDARTLTHPQSELPHMCLRENRRQTRTGTAEPLAPPPRAKATQL